VGVLARQQSVDWEYSLINSGVMFPQVPGKLLTSQTNGVEVGGRGVITKGAASIDNTIGPLDDESVHSHTVWVVTHQPESSGSQPVLVAVLSHISLWAYSNQSDTS
jgi:hypothetical protein